MVPHLERLMDTCQNELTWTQTEQAEQSVTWLANSPLPLAPPFNKPEISFQLLKKLVTQKQLTKVTVRPRNVADWVAEEAEAPADAPSKTGGRVRGLLPILGMKFRGGKPSSRKVRVHCHSCVTLRSQCKRPKSLQRALHSLLLIRLFCLHIKKSLALETSSSTKT